MAMMVVAVMLEALKVVVRQADQRVQARAAAHQVEPLAQALTPVVATRVVLRVGQPVHIKVVVHQADRRVRVKVAAHPAAHQVVATSTVLP